MATGLVVIGEPIGSGDARQQMDPTQDEGQRLRAGVRGHDEHGYLMVHTWLRKLNVDAWPASTGLASKRRIFALCGGDVN